MIGHNVQILLQGAGESALEFSLLQQSGMFTQRAAPPTQPSFAPTTSSNNGHLTLAQQGDALRAQA